MQSQEQRSGNLYLNLLLQENMKILGWRTSRGAACHAQNIYKLTPFLYVQQCLAEYLCTYTICCILTVRISCPLQSCKLSQARLRISLCYLHCKSHAPLPHCEEAYVYILYPYKFKV